MTTKKNDGTDIHSCEQNLGDGEPGEGDCRGASSEMRGFFAPLRMTIFILGAFAISKRQLLIFGAFAISNDSFLSLVRWR
jgi:hypothetical protein